MADRAKNTIGSGLAGRLCKEPSTAQKLAQAQVAYENTYVASPVEIQRTETPFDLAVKSINSEIDTYEAGVRTMYEMLKRWMSDPNGIIDANPCPYAGCSEAVAELTQIASRLQRLNASVVAILEKMEI